MLHVSRGHCSRTEAFFLLRGDIWYVTIFSLCILCILSIPESQALGLFFFADRTWGWRYFVDPTFISCVPVVDICTFCKHPQRVCFDYTLCCETWVIQWSSGTHTPKASRHSCFIIRLVWSAGHLARSRYVSFPPLPQTPLDSSGVVFLNMG